MSKNDVPVLLIGLGGIGSSIVDRTYGKLKKEGELDFLEALVFDTDQNELEKLENIPSECKIQTSTDKTVKYVLERDPNAKQWCPENKRVLDMQLINGAGQIRAVSRLALRSAMKAGKLTYVQNIKDKLYKLGGNASEKGVRIMIVASLMGGTGSGMFLQIPLYLREAFQSKFGMDKIEIQGTFLLPDVLKGSIDGKQKVNVYANAYASLKELNAINMSLSSNRKFNVKLEYKPDQIDEDNDARVTEWPYDYCFIYDKEDTKGRVLDGIEDYKYMISENLYSQVYGPISDCLYSYFINTIREIIRKNSRNIYGGVGIGKLIYPYEDICDYITYKSINESMQEQLLRINTSYKIKLEQYEKDKQAGNDAEKPILENYYIDQFNQLSKTDKFFKEIYKQVVVGDINEEKPRETIDDYIDFFENDVENQVNQFVENNEISQPNRSKMERMVEGELRRNIYVCEESFKNFRQAIDSRIESLGESKANNDFGVYYEDKESEFDKFLKKDNVYINPIGIRYILYSIKQYLEDESNFVNENIDDLKIKIKKQEEEKLKDVFKNASNLEQAMNHALKADNNPADKFVFKTLKKFKDEYCNQGSKHYKFLRDYACAVYKHGYIRKALEIINILIDEYENMFDRLEEQGMVIQKKIEELLHKNEGSYGKLNIYVFGKASYKEKLWESIPVNLRVNTLSNVLPEEMHKNLSKNCKLILKGQANSKAGYEELFNKLIVEGCKRSLKSNKNIEELLHINILNALSKEYDFEIDNGKINDISEKEKYIKEKLHEVINRTQPFTPQSDDSTDFVIWGINDNLRMSQESPNDKPKIESVLTNLDISASKVCTDSNYSEFEITFLVSRYGLEVKDFRKFFADVNNHNNDGEYYTCYNEVLKGLSEDASSIRNIEITPHIDKRWHKILPAIGEEEVEADKDDNAKAFIFGLVNDYIVIQEKKIGEKTKLQFLKKLGSITATNIKSLDGTQISGNLSKLQEGLQSNPEFVDDIVKKIKEHIEEVKNDVGIDDIVFENDTFIKNLLNVKLIGYDNVHNVVDILITLFNECKSKPEEEKHEIFDHIIKCVIKIIDDISKAYFSDLDEIKHNTASVLKKLINESKLRKNIKDGEDVFYFIISPLENQINEYGEE